MDPTENTGPDGDGERLAVPWESYYHRDTVLFAIDAGLHMHVQGADDDETPFMMAMRAAARFMEIKLVNSPKDHVGVMLWNTGESKITTHTKGTIYPHTLEYAPLKQVNVPSTYDLQNVVASMEIDADMGKKRFVPSAQMPIDHVLSNALHVITSHMKMGTRRIFFITNQDEPHTSPTKKFVQRACIDKVRDYHRRGVDLEPFFISAPGSFHISTFYADILGVYDDGLLNDSMRPWRLRQWQDQNMPKRGAWDLASKFAELEEQIGHREMPKRVVLDLLLDLGALSKGDSKAPHWRIHVKGYNLISEATRDLPVKVTSYGNEDPYDLYEVVNVTRPISATTGADVKPEQMTNAYELCESDSPHAYVSFTDDEMRRIRQCECVPGLTLLGFKDRSTLRFYENVKHAYFLYPSDLEHPGSKCAFAAMLQAMLKKRKLALCVFVPRENAVPSIAVLLPQAEEFDADGQQCEPPGMHMIIMPYADDIRAPPTTKSLSANAAQIGAASKLIESYTRKSAFNPDAFGNPALQYHYDLLMSSAFNTPPPVFHDTVLPDYDMIERRSHQYMDAWHDTMKRDQRVQADTAVTSTSAVSDELVRRLHREGTLGRLTVHDLKLACDMYGLPKPGRKAEIMAALSKYLSTH